MRHHLITLVAGSLLLAACSQSSDDNAAENVAKPAKKHGFCFFKDEEMKGWTAARAKDGSITLKGKAHVKDPRYKALLGQPTVEGSVATIAPTIGQNDTGFATADNWWDLSATLPNSAAVTEVRIECGAKTVADLPVPPAG